MGMLLWQLRVGMDVNLYDNLHSAAWSKSAYQIMYNYCLNGNFIDNVTLPL